MISTKRGQQLRKIKREKDGVKIQRERERKKIKFSESALQTNRQR